jgi:hypothetical protein
MLELKRTLDGRTIAYPVEPLLVEAGVRAVLLFRIDGPEVIAGGRVTLEPGTLSLGYFWCERPYNVYQWLYGGETLVHYINLGRCVRLSDQELVWDDYAVDILAYPDGTVHVVDEEEVPATLDATTRGLIAGAKHDVLADVAAVVAACEAETRTLLRAEANVVQR